MKMPIKSTRDIIIRTDAWDEAVEFYGTVLGFPVTHSSETLVGFETGAFCLYLEKGEAHGPVFECLVSDVQAAKRKLVEGGCTVIEENTSVPRCYLRDSFGMIFNIGKANE